MNENELNPVQEETTLQPETETEKKPRGDKRSPGEIAIAVVAVVLIVAMIVALVAGGLGNVQEPADSEVATSPADGNPEDVTCKGSYTVTDEQAIADTAKVVATMGDSQMTNADLQIYYWMQVVSFLNDYGAYASAMGLDYTQPLDTQMMDENWTWQQYFLQCALEAWSAYEALSQEAIAVGFDQQSEDYLTYTASLREEVEKSAVNYGFESLEDMLVSFVGTGSTVDAYIDYMQSYYLGYLYFNSLYDQLIPTAEEIEAYFDENAAAYAESGISKDEGVYIDVRHILVMPKGGTTENGTTTYSDEEWEEARKEAQTILDNWLAGDPTEERFADLANINSADSDGTDGGLYTYVAEGDMVAEFNDWCFDPERQVGDYGLVKTQFGYHVMYFSGSHPIWYTHAENDLMNEISADIVPDIVEKYDSSFDYTAMVLGYVNLAA